MANSVDLDERDHYEAEEAALSKCFFFSLVKKHYENRPIEMN